MPYQWSESKKAGGLTRSLRLWPHRSLPKRGFALFIMATSALISMPLFTVLGTKVLWALLPFLSAAVAGIWLALSSSYKSAAMGEELTINAEEVHLLRTNVRGPDQEWGCQSYWARVHMHPTGGPVPHYVTLTGKGREVEIGAFLCEEERKALYAELADALREAGLPKPVQT